MTKKFFWGTEFHAKWEHLLFHIIGTMEVNRMRKGIPNIVQETTSQGVWMCIIEGGVFGEYRNTSRHWKVLTGRYQFFHVSHWIRKKNLKKSMLSRHGRGEQVPVCI